jgi:hypothetical protein
MESTAIGCEGWHAGASVKRSAATAASRLSGGDPGSESTSGGVVSTRPA